MADVSAGFDFMEVVIVLAVVGFGYLLLRNQALVAGGVLAGPGAATPAQLAAQVNANAQQAQFQLQGINVIESQPDTSLALISTGASTGLGAAQSALQNAGSSLASAVPVVGAILGIGLSLLGQHTARVKGATAENSGIDAIVPAFDADLREINTAYRAGSISPTIAVSYLAQVQQQYWQYMAQFQGRPGVAMRACPSGQVGGPMGHGGCTSGQPTCDKGCTAGCCVGCSAINGSIANCVWAVQTGYHGPVAICQVFAGKFGAHDRAGYQLSW